MISRLEEVSFPPGFTWSVPTDLSVMYLRSDYHMPHIVFTVFGTVVDKAERPILSGTLQEMRGKDNKQINKVI